jgi:hypothetical protein
LIAGQEHALMNAARRWLRANDCPIRPRVGGRGRYLVPPTLASRSGSRRIISTSPALPWGITPAYPDSGALANLPSRAIPDLPNVWVNMVFYREDPIEIPDIPVGPKPH